MHRIGFIGVGTIGLPMARVLLRKGFDVLGCDPNAEARAAFADAGGRVCEHARQCAGEQTLILMLADAAQISAVMADLRPALRNSRPERVLVMSTVLPDTVRRLASDLAPLGIPVIDAPVSGGPLGAADGTLSIMAGGAETDIDSALPVLEAMSRVIHRCGGLGMGELAKITSNLVGVITLMTLSEALALGCASGLSLDAMLAVMESGSGRNAVSGDAARARQVYDEFASNAPRTGALIRINAKDLSLALKLAEGAGVATPLLRAAQRAMAGLDAEATYAQMRSFVEAAS